MSDVGERRLGEVLGGESGVQIGGRRCGGGRIWTLAAEG